MVHRTSSIVYRHLITGRNFKANCSENRAIGVIENASRVICAICSSRYVSSIAVDMEPMGGLAEVAVTGKKGFQRLDQFSMFGVIVADQPAQRATIKAPSFWVVAERGQKLIKTQIAKIGDGRPFPFLTQPQTFPRLLLALQPGGWSRSRAADAEHDICFGMVGLDAVGQSLAPGS